MSKNYKYYKNHYNKIKIWIKIRRHPSHQRLEKEDI